LVFRGRIGADIRASVVRRMVDLAAVRQEFEQRFWSWYNKTTRRFGTLLAERFTSLVVEDSVTSLRTVAG